jgi:hypothetical protein
LTSIAPEAQLLTAHIGGSARSYLTLSTLATVLQSQDDHPHHRLTMPPQHGSLFYDERWPVAGAARVTARPDRARASERCWVFVV